MSRTTGFHIVVISVVFSMASLFITRTNAEDSCRFTKHSSEIGDITQQKVTCDLQLEMAIRQGTQIVESKSQEITRQQLREIKILSVGESAPKKAKVTYQTSRLGLKQGESEPTQTDQPVAGKSYFVIRQADQLIVTDLQGKTPPRIELDIVKSNLEAFGLPNPIANFFHEKTIRIGQTVDLPVALAKQLLGFQDAVGDVSGLTLKLVAIRKLGSANAAIFETKLIARNAKPSGIKLELTGQMAIEINTCRTLAVSLNGPVYVEEILGPPEGRFSVTSDGEIQVAVRASYATDKK